jgi:purine-binding chemotaxis protein CheW
MTAANDTSTNVEGLRHLAGKYLTFHLNDESYALPVLKVREIIRFTDIRSMPGMPAYIRGVINLRGKIVPVLDLRLRFGFKDVNHTDQTCIVVVQVRTEQLRTTAMGLVVDGVEEVAQIGAADIEPTPDFGVQRSADYLLGMAKFKGAVRALLDIDRVIGAEAAEQLVAVTAAPLPAA